jgi:prepilin-type N-terminal cleavage/methylation domain-containing protein
MARDQTPAATSESSRRRGFSLVELLVVIAIIGVLVALLLPAVQAGREAARRVHCLNNIRQVGVGLLNYEQARKRFPPGVEIDASQLPSNGLCRTYNDIYYTNKPGWWSWIVRILPYVEEAPLYNTFNLQLNAMYGQGMTANHDAYRQVVSWILCTDDPQSHRVGHASCGGQIWCDRAYTNYLGVTGTQGGATALKEGYKADGMFPDTNVSVELRTVTDGTSHTLFVGERPVVDMFTITGTFMGDYGWWAAGVGSDWPPCGRADNILDSSEGLRAGDPDLGTDVFHWWSYHPTGAHFLLVDGSGQYFSYSIDYNAFLAMSSRNGNEVFESP